MTTLTLNWPDGLSFTEMEATVNALEAEYGCHVRVEPEPLALTRHEMCETIAALDTLLTITRVSLDFAGRYGPDVGASITAVENLRSKIREGLR